MTLKIAVGKLRAALHIACFAIVAVFVDVFFFGVLSRSFPVSSGAAVAIGVASYVVLFGLFNASMIFAFNARDEELTFGPDGSLTLRGMMLHPHEIAYVYEDSGYILVRARRRIGGFLFLGHSYVLGRKLMFKKPYISNAQELSQRIKELPVKRRRFLWSRLPHYLGGLLSNVDF